MIECVNTVPRCWQNVPLHSSLPVSKSVNNHFSPEHFVQLVRDVHISQLLMQAEISKQ